MLNAWTPGLYVVFRVLLGSYLVVHFLHLTPWAAELFSGAGMLPEAGLSPLTVVPGLLSNADAPWFAIMLTMTGACAGLLIAAGRCDRVAALVAWAVLASLFIRNPLIANPALPYLGWLLIAHCFVPPARLGSLGARGADGWQAWSLPRSLFLSAWIVLALSYSYSGYTKLLSDSWVAGDTIRLVLQNPLARDHALRDLALWLPEEALRGLTWFVLYVELLLAPLALSARMRPVLWSAMFAVQLGFLTFLNFADLTAPMLLFHMLTFDPAWIDRPAAVGRGTVFYDGECGLCHRTVSFVLAEDGAGRIRLAPIQSPAYQAAFAGAPPVGFGQSIVWRSPDGRIAIRSDAVVHILSCLGGIWTALAVALWMVPRPLRDWAYDLVGRNRKSFFAAPPALCPVIPATLRDRFVG
jgi:predicted DCC family thiol-disulfide oxidoreductase YuxK